MVVASARGGSAVGDSHNFGRRVRRRGGAVYKPRPLFWEWLISARESPLRGALAGAAERGGIGRDAFGFLPELRFEQWRASAGGAVQEIDLAPLGALGDGERVELARVVGRAVALFAWLGIADLHWENLALGVGARGQVVLAPLDVEMIFGDLALPTQTQLLPDADPEYAELCRHACGVRRVLPYLGKPVAASDLVAMAGAYRRTLAVLDASARAIASVLGALPELRETPIRVCLRSTADYVAARQAPANPPLWPPLLDAEHEQLDRGDIPYFFRVYGRPGIHYYGDAALRTVKTLPRSGGGPRLEPLLRVSRALRSASRKSLREQGLFAVLAAFDHPSLLGTHASDELEVAFRARRLVVKLAGGATLDARRDLRAFVGSVYSACTCGEVRAVLVPPVTVCDDGRRRMRQGTSRKRARKL